MLSFAISDFVRRQTKDSEFSYFDGSDDELLDLVTESYGNYKEGYRDGVVLVPVDPTKFFSGVIQLRDGDKLVGEYKARRKGEKCTKTIHVVGGKKMPAAAVDVILYSHDVLAENKEHSCNADWEIISINASAIEGEVPLTVGALTRNFFCEPGGTDTKMTAEEFVEAFKVSREYWCDKAMAAPKE